MNNPLKHLLTTELLQRYFPVVKDLRSYLSDILETQDGASHLSFLPTEEDTPLYRELVNTSCVALKPCGAPPRFHTYPPMTDMREIIDKSQERIFRNKGGGPQNVLTSGYRVSREGERINKGMTRIGITNTFVNTIVTALQAPEWETLLQRIGIDAMIHLLSQTCLFVSLPNDCLCQMTGEPVIHMLPSVSSWTRPATTQKAETATSKKRAVPDPDEHQRPSKRLKVNSPGIVSASRAAVKIYSPADIHLIRQRVFYARPALVPHTKDIVVGLPPKHILNRLHPSYQRNEKVNPETYVDPDPRKQMDAARHLAKYVFPRQYGLSSPFMFAFSKRDAAVAKLPDFSDREVDIKALGACKTPKRLKETLFVLEKMLWRHGKCGYKPLREHACPSKIKMAGRKELDSSIILELMSERSQPQSQVSLRAPDRSIDSEGNSIMPLGLTQAQRHVKNKPRFVEFACSHFEVYRYVFLVTKAVIPKTFWGSESNFKLVLKHAKEFISCRRYETLSLHHIVQGFSTAACEWLMPPGGSILKQTRVPVSDALKRRELLEDFLFWYFDSFLLPLLKTTFYITESSAFRNHVLYFRQDDWEVLCAPLIERLTSGTFEQMNESDAQEVLRQRKLGFSFVRLLPKETGVRPVVNLRRIQSNYTRIGVSQERSINQILQAAFQILTYEKKTQPQLLGASVFNSDEIYSKVKSFKSRLSLDANGNMPKLYFVKVDVQACFDTIEQSKLLGILREVISEDAYTIQKYGQVTSAAGKIRRAYAKKAVPEDDHPHFLQYAKDLANALRHTILVDQVVYPSSKKEELLQLLEEHITENIVKIGNKYYRQMVGIPQGSVLSSILCSFFYGDLEKRFKRFTDDSQSVLLRLIDDYLFITTSLSRAKGFLNTMGNGHPDYGCFISKEKTLTNFDHDDEVVNVTGPYQRTFPWCGYTIDMTNLSISGDYSRYQEHDLHNSLTVDRGRRPGLAFVNKMLLLAKAKSHIIYSDTDLNTEHVVYLNIYQNFLLSALKMHGYIREWGLTATKNTAFIRKTVRQMIAYSYAATTSKASHKVAKAHNARCSIQKDVVTWLGMHAFHAILSRKPQNYRPLLNSLAFDLGRPQNRKRKKHFRSLVREGLAELAHIVF